MASDDEPIIIGDWAGLLAKERTRASGKQRVTFKVSGKPLLFNLNEHTLGAPIAEAITEAFREALNSSTEQAKPATRAARGRAATAFANGARWATKKYSGGRIGAMAPNQSDRRGSDSGRLARSLAARWVPSVKTFMINVASNRLTTEFRASVPGQIFMQWLGRLLAPALQSETVNKGVAKALGLTVQQVTDARSALRKQIADNLKALADAGRGLGGELEQLGDEEP